MRVLLVAAAAMSFIGCSNAENDRGSIGEETQALEDTVYDITAGDLRMALHEELYEATGEELCFNTESTAQFIDNTSAKALLDSIDASIYSPDDGIDWAYAMADYSDAMFVHVATESRRFLYVLGPSSGGAPRPTWIAKGLMFDITYPFPQQESDPDRECKVCYRESGKMHASDCHCGQICEVQCGPPPFVCNKGGCIGCPIVQKETSRWLAASRCASEAIFTDTLDVQANFHPSGYL